MINNTMIIINDNLRPYKQPLFKELKPLINPERNDGIRIEINLKYLTKLLDIKSK